MLSMNLRVEDSSEVSSALDMEELSMELTPPLSHTEGAFAVAQWGSLDFPVSEVEHT